ncbi:MAG: FHA domain-containing protein [Planctomycetaceae bacterium]|nr:FHA domain-containing protein [Planctomycetaceae bacterium]
MNQAGDIHAFASACRAKLPLQLRVTDERTGHSEDVLVERPFAVLGSSELCDVRMVHPDVSRHHACVQILEGRALCCDLGSRTGTHWGTEIRSRSWLAPGELIFLGPFRVELIENEFLDSASDEMPVAPDYSRPTRVQQPNMHLTFLNARSRSGRSRVSRLRNPITLVGWSHLCNLRLQHHSVGRVHCSLVWTTSGVWAVDLMCQEGTRVNGELINFARLDDADELTLGRFQLKIAYGSSAEMPIFTAAGTSDASPDAEYPRHSSRPAAPPEVAPIVPEQTPSIDRPRPLPQETQAPLARIVPRTEMTELRPSGASKPMRAGGELSMEPLSETTAVSLMQQFAVMQQQMFDHTYQVLAVVTEAFQTAHNQQLQLIREELMRVHDLNRELSDLNRRQAAAGGASPTTAGSPENRSAPPTASEELRRLTFPEALLPELPISETAQASVLAGSALRAADATHIAKASIAKGSPVGDLAEGDPTPVEPSTSKPRKKQNPDQRAASAKPAASPVPSAPAIEATAGQDVHAWLSGRISELTEERTTRWQKILQLLTQGGPGK